MFGLNEIKDEVHDLLIMTTLGFILNVITLVVVILRRGDGPSIAFNFLLRLADSLFFF
jgi:hypothetical protein